MWTLLQVSVAVLLDNFVSETAREKEQVYKQLVKDKLTQQSIGDEQVQMHTYIHAHDRICA
jgi:hypothetical protein